MRADDHPVVRTGLVMALGTDPGIEVVAEAADGLDAVELAAEHRPDVLLLDLQMPELDGVGATARILDELSGVNVMILTTYDSDHSIVAAVEAGAAGYLLKGAALDDLLAAVRGVAAGGMVLRPEIASKLAARQREPRLPDLTDREIDVLTCVARGQSNAKVAEELFVSTATVKTHLIHIFQELQVSDRTSAVTTAIEEGIIEL